MFQILGSRELLALGSLFKSVVVVASLYCRE